MGQRNFIEIQFSEAGKAFFPQWHHNGSGKKDGNLVISPSGDYIWPVRNYVFANIFKICAISY
jgi:hypothetical protein